MKIGQMAFFPLLTCLILCWMTFCDAHAQETFRRTRTVEVIQQAKPAVVPLFTQTGPASIGMGAGAIIDPSGLILTADHVTLNFPGVALFGLERVPYEILGRVPERDLALIQVKLPGPLPAIKLGRSHDVLAGETILVGGNPSGRGIVFSEGIVNDPSIDPSWPNLLVKSFWRGEMRDVDFQRVRSTGGRPDFIQFDASSNRGNSGGPLINLDGEVVGIVATKSFNEEGVNWAVPADRVRLLLPYLLQPEERGGFRTGVTLDLLSEPAQVLSVQSGSAAEETGLGCRDIITSVDGQPITNCISWYLALQNRKPGNEMAISWRQNGESKSGKLTLKEFEYPTVTADKKRQGISFQRFEGQYLVLPDFSKLQPSRVGVTQLIGLGGIATAEDSNFAIVFSGFIEFESPGLVRINLGSDDGGKFYLGNDLVIDNDLPHPYQKLSRWVRVPRGLVPFRLEYADAGGDKQLSLTVSNEIDEKEATPIKFYCEE